MLSVGSFNLRQVRGRQAGGALLGDQVLEQRGDAGRGRDVSARSISDVCRHGFERTADAVGIGALIQGIQPRNDLAAVFIDEMDLGEVPACVAHQHPVQVPERVRHFEAVRIDDDRAVAASLGAPLGAREGQA